jgi:hypothetical protein
MKTFLDQVVDEQQTFLRRYRVAYLRSVAAEMGMPNSDLRDVALREAVALVRFAMDPRGLQSDPENNVTPIFNDVRSNAQ